MLTPRTWTLGAACLAVLTLTGPALAQSSPIIDRLVAGSADIVPLPLVDRSMRAAHRYAIVIGNRDYDTIPDLNNAVADAKAVSAYLRQHGFLVNEHIDLTKRGFEDMLRRVLFDVNPDTEVVLFYAGHGFQIGSDNYLVPVDANLDSVYDVPFETVSLDSLVDIVESRARLQVMMVDSSRDNPFEGRSALTGVGNTLQETAAGFSIQDAPQNAMLVFSTSPGQLAFEGDGNSPFTASFIDEATDDPDQLVRDTFEGVRERTVERTNGEQIPWDSSTLIEPVSFGLTGAAMRPIDPNAKRGIGDRTAAELVQMDATIPVIGADFIPEVNIGPAIVKALNLQGDDTVTFTGRPTTGYLMREDLTGLQREVTGQTLNAQAVSELVLISQSVQIPARSLDVPMIPDSFTVAVAGSARTVLLELAVHPCDFAAGDHLDPQAMGITRYPNEIAPDAAFAACFEATLANPEVARFHHQLGRAYLAARQTDKAIASFEKARDLGHVRAWQELGLLARYAERGTNNSGTPDSDAVRQLFARGVKEGDPYAMHTLGYELLTNGGSDAAEAEGFDLMNRAIEVGHTFAMNALTGIYLNPESKYHDPERALRFMRESVARQDIYGYHNLGLAYAYGQAGLDVDPVQAVDLLTAASDGGHPDAPMSLATLYQQGVAPGGVDLPKAVDWMIEALERGNAYAAATAAYYIRTAPIPGKTEFDAALIAAKGSTLADGPNTQGALAQLVAMPENVMNGGSQALLKALGYTIDVDGAWGAGSQRVMDEALADNGGEAAQTAPLDRIQQLARIYWRNTPLRVDLY